MFGWLELAAYPALLAAMYGAYRVGRKHSIGSDDAFEAARVVVLALLLGVLVAVQVDLVLAGVVRSELGLVAGVIGIAGSLALVGLQLVEWFDARAHRKGSGASEQS
jgi:hypothetical protein